MLTPQEYAEMFSACSISKDQPTVNAVVAICKAMMANDVTYWGVEKATGIPWLVIAGIHFRESSQSFKCHLHNGDPLTERTIHVPAGRPIEGAPPFTWSASAIDAMKGRQHPFQWDVGSALQFCEQYNGMGYARHGINSPYVWGGTDKYLSGLFVADGTLDPEKKDPRPGIAALFKTLQDLGVSLDFNPCTPAASIH